MITTHPSAVLRLRGKPAFDAAFAALVDDLRLADLAASGGVDAAGAADID